MNRLMFLLVLLCTLLLGIAVSALPARAATSVWINEIHYDNDSTDVGEGVEIAGPAGTELTGWQLVPYNGNGGTTYTPIINLTGTIPDQDNGYGALFYDIAGLQNGAPDGVALVNDVGAVVQFLSYEGSFTATNGPANGMTSTDIGVAEGSSTPVGHSLQLVGTGTTYEEFTWAEPMASTYNAPNTGQSFGGVVITPTPTSTPQPSCGAPATFIHEVQGSGTASPLEGSVVTIEGIVVGDFQDNDGDEFDTDLDGFYVQEEAADFDTDEATSEGVFVFAPAAFDVVPGDVVRLTGEVTEFDGLTELTDVTGLELCGTAPLPDPVDLALPVENVDDFEMYEGMLIEFPQTLVISEYFNFDRFNEVVLTQPLPGEDFLHQPTAIEEPGSPAAAARAAYNQVSRITLDDARSAQNPDPAYHPNGEEFTLDNRFRGGDLVQDVTGILDDRFGLYRIQPTTGATYIPQNPRPAEPDPVGGDLTVASFNVLNYFLTIDSGPDVCGPNQDQDCRGADSVEEFERQRAKILAALLEIDADIYGLIEMENTTGVEPLADIVDGLNDVLGAGTYAYIDTGVVGPDAIRQGIIYKPGTVTPLGDYAVLDTPEFLDPNSTGEAQNRPPVVQSFTENSTGGVVTVVVNHLKSKGSACGAGDDDPEQGNCNLTRTLAAGILVDWLATDPTGSGDPDYLIIGDLNAYDKEDPIDEFREGADDVLGTYDDYTDLLLKYEGEYAYSYVFDGQVGYLDYAMSNAPLTSQVTGTTAWHINADEPDILDYDTSFKQPPQAALYEPNAYRSSDHDPIIVGLNLAAPVISLQYHWDPGNGTGAQSGEWTLFSNRTFVDDQGNVGLWVYQPSQYRLTLSYGPGQQCTALLSGTFRTSTTLVGRSLCRDGSNAQGVWSAQIVQGNARALEAAEALAPATE